MNKASRFFSGLNLKPEVLLSLEENKNLRSTRLQEKAIPVLVNQTNSLVGEIVEDSEQILTYVLPILEKLDYDSLAVQSIIFVPTQKDAETISKEFLNIGKFTEIRTVVVHRDGDYESQVKALICDKPQVIIGSADRIMEMFDNNVLDLTEVRYCVIDESEQFLSEKVIFNISSVVENFNDKPQWMIFTKSIQDLNIKFVEQVVGKHEYVRSEQKIVAEDFAGDEEYYLIQNRFFTEAMIRLACQHNEQFSVVFCNRRHDIKPLANALSKRGLHVSFLGVEMGLSQKASIAKKFLEKGKGVLVCTDSTFKGLELNEIGQVFHYGLPQHIELYAKRLYPKAKSTIIISTDSISDLNKLEEMTGRKVKRSVMSDPGQFKSQYVSDELKVVQRILTDLQNVDKKFDFGEEFEKFQLIFENVEKTDLIKSFYVWRFSSMMKHFEKNQSIEDDPNREVIKKVKPNNFKPNFKRNKFKNKNKNKPHKNRAYAG